MSLFGLLIVVLVICVIIWAVRTLMAAFSLPQPIQGVIYVVIVLILLVWFLKQTGWLPIGLL